MLNKLLFYLQRPEKGYDPVPKAHAEYYFNREYEKERMQPAINRAQSFFVDMKGKSVLDLGAGPGQFSKYFHDQGCDVTWQDISHHYLAIFKMKYPDIEIHYQIGYLEEARGKFDLLFNRVCWYYSINDKQFVKHILNLLKPGGKALLVIPNGACLRGTLSFVRKIQFYLNDIFGIKIGHPWLSVARLKKNFCACFSFLY